MLSNLVVNQETFVLFIDNVGMENQSMGLIKNLLMDQNGVLHEFYNCNDSVVHAEVKSLSGNIFIILKPISKILYEYDPEAIFDFINEIRVNTYLKQIIAWATGKNIEEHFVIPFLEHMADVTVNIIDTTNLSILVRKRDLVSMKYYTYEIVDEVFKVTEIMRHAQESSEPSIKPENLSTFKISLNADEEIARHTLKLPYEINTEEEKECNDDHIKKSENDLNDEDPDNDLNI